MIKTTVAHQRSSIIRIEIFKDIRYQQRIPLGTAKVAWDSLVGSLKASNTIYT